MRKILSRFLDTKSLGIFCSLVAIAAFVGCIMSIGALATGERVVELSNATANTTTRDITWTIGNESLTLTLGTGPTLTTNSIEYASGDNISISLTHNGTTNVCDQYEVFLSAGGWNENQPYYLQCTSYSTTQEFYTDSNFNIPSDVSGITLGAQKRNQPGPGPDIDPSGPIIVNIAADSFGENGKTATFQFGEQNSRSITFNTAWNATNNPHFEFENGNSDALRTAFTNGLRFTAGGECMDAYDGNSSPHDNYYVRLESQGGWGINYACENGNYTLPFTGEENIPPESYTIRVMQKTQPQQDIGVEFENVSLLAQGGSYIKVTSRDESLAGKTFIITPSSGTISCNEHDGETHCSQQFSQSPFDQNSDFFYYISVEGGQWDDSTMMVFFRGAAGLGGSPIVTKVGNDYEFMLNGAGIPADTNHISIAIEEPHEHGGGGEDEPQHEGDPVPATSVKIKSNIGDSSITKSFYLARISINNNPVNDNGKERCEISGDDRANDEVCPSEYTVSNFSYNKVANVNTVEISFGTLFIHKYINSVKVNGTTYQIPFDYTNRQEWLAHYYHQMTGFTIDNVPYNEGGYVIEVDVDELPGQYQQIGNFLWTNAEDEKYRPDGSENDEYIGHSNLEVVSVLCHIAENNDVFFNVATDKVPDGCVFEYRPDDNDEHKTGSLVVPEGSTITVRLKPTYGWQVTSFKISGDDVIETDPGAVAQYTFGIHKGNAHLGAVVTEVDDEVNAASEKVKSGTISLGGEEITEGTAMLTVGDADLTDEQKAEFQTQAGNYNVSTFLDIDLDQVFYNGMGDYWQGAEMSELAHEATITLTLEEGVDGNSVILVHKKHDGTYEIIPTTYDAKTHTITFKTSSFSDYAIASANVKNADTVDRIIKYVLILTASLTVSIFCFTKAKQTVKQSEESK